MFDIDDTDENDIFLALADMMLDVSGIMIEQDCDDLRPILLSILTKQPPNSIYISAASFVVCYVGRETNNWRSYMDISTIEEFFADEYIEDMIDAFSELNHSLARRSVDRAVEDLYGFIAEQFISTYEP